MKLVDFLIKNTKKFPKKTALVCNNINISYYDFSENVRKLSYGFEKLGIKKGNKIALILNNSLEFIYSFYAAANIGAIVVPINISLSKKDLNNQLILTKSKFIITWSAYLEAMISDKKIFFKINKKNCILVGNKINHHSSFEVLIKYAPDNYRLGSHVFSSKIDFIFGLTSGSTSEPKIVVFSQKTKIQRSLHGKKLYKLNSKEVIIVSTPMYHSISLRLIVLPILLGGSCVVMEKFTNKNWLLFVKKYKVTFSILVASQLESLYKILLKKTIITIQSLKSIVSCCSHLDNEIKLKLSKKLKCSFFDTYGASEVGTISNLNVGKEKNKHYTLGKIVPGVKILFQDKKNTINTNIPGEILCKSENVFSGYYKNKKLNKKLFYKQYFYTGDIGYKDKNGYLVLSGRKKDIIITGGVNVFASDVEKILNLYPKIKESAVIGIKDQILGEAVFAIIVLYKRNKINFRDLNLFCASNLADYQMPVSFDVIDELPRGNLNKISKYKLREKYKDFDLLKSIRKILK